jgi:hypothetical protein|tara:strand:+ start:191 stop:3046 length:2856 start_codon:yes stop_codon:yes gene_type:complete
MTVSKIVAAAASGAGGSSVTTVDDVFQINTYDGEGNTNKGQRIRNGVELGSEDAGSFVFFGTPGNAVNLSGSANSGLYRTSDLSGNADGKVFTLSTWFQSDFSTNFTSYRISTTEGGGTTTFYAMTSGPLFKVAATNAAGTLILDTGWKTIMTSGPWHHALISVDLSNTSYRHLYIDNVAVLEPSSSWSSYTNQDIDFTAGYHYVNAYRASTGADGSTGGFTKIFLDYNYLDLSQASNRQKFIVSNGQGGYQPSTTDLTTLSPIVYLPLDNQNAVTKNLGSGGDFTELFPETIEQRSQGGPYYDSSVGKGGLVMVKARESVTSGYFWWLADTVRGKNNNDFMKSLTLNANDNQDQYPFASYGGIKSLTSDGFTLQPAIGGSSAWAFQNNKKYYSLTWRIQEKFFDIVQYTGNGSNRTIAHNLNGTPGMIWVKRIQTGTSDWYCYHRGVNGGSNPEQYYVQPRGTDAQAGDGSYWNNTAPTSTHFSLGTNTNVNENGATFIAYIWAHNDGDGEFGANGDEDIIKCGTVTGTGGSIKEIDLGFVPQWIMVKRVTTDTEGFQSYHSWIVQDSKRGLSPEPLGQAYGYEHQLMFNQTFEEGYRGNGSTAGSDHQFLITDNGFALPSSGTVEYNRSGHKYIYVAVRKTQFDASNITKSNEVFNIDEAGARQSSPPSFEARFDVGTAIWKNAIDGSNDFRIGNRTNTRRYVALNTNADASQMSNFRFDFDKGWNAQNSPDTNRLSWMFREARNFHDCVFYKGTGSTQNVGHNLGVAPEMMWIKLEGTNNWVVYHKDMDSTEPQDYGMYLDDYTPRVDSVNFFNDTAPTASQFTVGTASKTNGSGNHYHAFLWAGIPGFVKFGGYTGTGSDQTIDAGFSTGTRFVMIKNIDSNANWMTANTDMGFGSGSDQWLEFNADSPWSGSDFADPTTSGFTVKGSNGAVNANGDKYIYWAIASP